MENNNLVCAVDLIQNPEGMTRIRDARYERRRNLPWDKDDSEHYIRETKAVIKAEEACNRWYSKGHPAAIYIRQFDDGRLMILARDESK